MKRIYNLFSAKHLQQVFSQSLLVSVLATTGLLSTSWQMGTKVYAEIKYVNDTEVNQYAKAASAIERERQKAFDEIKKKIGNAEVPNITCNDPNSFNSLPEAPKNIVNNYCKTSRKIVDDSGLSIERFNEILVENKNDEKLKKRIYDEVLRLQKKP